MEMSKEEKEARFKENVKNLFESNAKKMLENVQNGKAVFLPSEKALENVKGENSPLVRYPHLVRKAVDGKPVTGMTQILAQQALWDMKIDSKGNNFDIITYGQVNKVGSVLVKDENGKLPEKIRLPLLNEKGEAGYYDVYSAKDVKEQNLLPKLPARRNYTLQEYRTENGNIEEYLGKYLAAASQGAKFITTKKIASEFKANFAKELSAQIEKGNYASIIEIGKKANEVCRNTLRSKYGRDAENKNEAKLGQNHKTEKAVEKQPEKNQGFSMAD